MHSFGPVVSSVVCAVPYAVPVDSVCAVQCRRLAVMWYLYVGPSSSWMSGYVQVVEGGAGSEVGRAMDG